MKKSVLIFSIYLLPFFGISQVSKIYLGNIISDSATIKNNDIWENHFPSIFNSINKIEIRVLNSKLDEYIIFSYNKSWKLIKYKYNNETRKYDSLKINDSIKLEKIFENLVNNNIFSLPDSHKVVLGKYYYDLSLDEIYGAGMGVSHPFMDYVEFKIADKFRCYSYYQTKDFSDFYQENIEFRQFLNILKSFENLE